MKLSISKTVLAIACSLLFLIMPMGLRAQDSPQKAVASKTAKFGTVAKTDSVYTAALDAHNLAAGQKLIDKEGSLRGTVAKLFSTKGGGVLILNFDRDYKTAMTAVLNKSDFAKFPDMSQLDGKEVVVSGKFIDYHGGAEIVLSDPTQIVIVK